MLTAGLIEGFVGSVLAKKFDDATAIPQFHKELWELATSQHQYVAIAAPRGHAKSSRDISVHPSELIIQRIHFCTNCLRYGESSVHVPRGPKTGTERQ